MENSIKYRKSKKIFFFTCGCKHTLNLRTIKFCYDTCLLCNQTFIRNDEISNYFNILRQSIALAKHNHKHISVIQYENQISELLKGYTIK